MADAIPVTSAPKVRTPKVSEDAATAAGVIVTDPAAKLDNVVGTPRPGRTYEVLQGNGVAYTRQDN